MLIPALGWLSKIGKVLGMAGALSKLSPALGFLKSYWRESLILILLTVIGFGSWWYEFRTNGLKEDLLVTKIDLETSQANYQQLDEQLERIKSELAELESKNDDLESDIANSVVKIAELESRAPETVVRTVYNTVLPEQCDAKFSWMLGEALRLKEVGK